MTGASLPIRVSPVSFVMNAFRPAAPGLLWVALHCACAISIGAGCGAGSANRGVSTEAAAPIAPVQSDGGNYVLSSGGRVLEVDPRVGGRVVTFSLDGKNVLVGPSANADNYGSTFWTSPQSAWNWPPPPEIDNLAYTSVSGGTLTLEGQANASLGARITKAFSLDGATGAVTITYTIVNVGASQVSLAPWEVTRVTPGGLFFFPTGGAESAFINGTTTSTMLSTMGAAGVTWYAYTSSELANAAGTKLFAHGPHGWLAQVNQGLLFVKKFSPLTPAAEAPGEAEVEAFFSGDGTYVEAEDQGAYEPVAPGTSLAWSVRWYLVALPPGISASPGNPALVSLVEGL